MKNKYIATVISLLITSMATGQVKLENKTQADAIVFSKSETEYRQVQKELQQLEQQKKQLLTLMELYNEKQKKLLLRIEKLENNYDSITKTDIPAAAVGSSQNELLNATKQMQETQMSFNLQYLQLQSNMQNENRSYTAISNIMKTKHDTVKNSISNVR